MADNVIKRVSTIFTVKDDGFNQSLTNINKQMKLTQSEIKLAGERFKAFGGNTDDLKSKQDALSQQIANVRDKINLYNKSLEETPKKLEDNRKKSEELRATKDELNKMYRDAVKVYGEESAEAKKLSDELENVKKAYTESEAKIKTNVNTLNNHQLGLKNAETELAKLQGELKKTTTEIEKNSNKLLQAGDTLQTYGSKISNAGDKITTAGKALTLGVTAPVIAIGTAATKSSIEFESAFAGVKKTVNATDKQFKELNQGIKDMSKNLPTSASDIAHVAEAAGQLGIKTENILGFTKTIIDLGNATNLAGEEGASSLAKFANITQMSQKDFDRLGSTIVALGNNSATTEADIVAMAMRLAGAGAQVGLTESKILGLSAALSSVGIEAEAGGSSVSKVLVDMQLAVETGGKSLSNFAKVAGMSSKQFQQAFKNDASSALIAFIRGLADSEKKGKSAIKVLDDMGITEVRMRDALLRAAGAGDLFNKSIELGTKAWNENVALTNEANQRYATTESQLKMTKNQITDAAIQIGNNLLPAVRDAAVSIAKITDNFSKLSPKTQESIIKLAALAAVAGPVVTGVGGLANGIGGAISIIGKFASTAGAAEAASATIGTAASAAAGTGGVAGLVGSLGGVALAAAPYVAAAAAIAGAGYLVYKGLTQETIPAVDLFADKVEYTAKTVDDAGGYMASSYQTSVTKISQSTKDAIGSYLELDKEASKYLLSVRINSEKISKETADSMIKIYADMGTQITSKMKQNQDEQYKTLQNFFANTSALTRSEEADTLKKLQDNYLFEKQIVDYGVNEINAILTKASNEKRDLTDQEARTINNIQENMKKQAIQTLSQNEVEAQIILQRMKDYDGRITAEQAAEHIKKLNESRDKAVKSANDEYEKRIATITRMRDESKIITSDQADKLIAEAKRQRDGIIEKAEDTRLSALDKMRQLNRDLDNEVDTGTGEILTWWDKLARWWNGWKPEKKTFSYSTNYSDPWENTQSRATVGRNALGTNYFQGGMTYYNEKGYELIDLPVGSKIRNHAQSEVVVRRTAEEVANQMLSGLASILGTEKDVYLIMNHQVVGKAVVPIVSRELASNAIRKRS